MKILVVGAGSIGSYFGGMLAQADEAIADNGEFEITVGELMLIG